MKRTPREQLEAALAYTESRVEFYKMRAEEERKEAERIHAKLEALDGSAQNEGSTPQ